MLTYKMTTKMHYNIFYREMTLIPWLCRVGTRGLRSADFGGKSHIRQHAFMTLYGAQHSL